MARYEHAPISKTAMDLTVYREQVVRQFSRDHKDTVGNDLRQPSRERVTMIIGADSRRETRPVLAARRERLEAMHVWLRIGKEVPAEARAEWHHGVSAPPHS
jgi:hypothetical protein